MGHHSKGFTARLRLPAGGMSCLLRGPWRLLSKPHPAHSRNAPVAFPRQKTHRAQIGPTPREPAPPTPPQARALGAQVGSQAAGTETLVPSPPAPIWSPRAGEAQKVSMRAYLLQEPCRTEYVHRGQEPSIVMCRKQRGCLRREFLFPLSRITDMATDSSTAASSNGNTPAVAIRDPSSQHITTTAVTGIPRQRATRMSRMGVTLTRIMGPVGIGRRCYLKGRELCLPGATRRTIRRGVALAVADGRRPPWWRERSRPVLAPGRDRRWRLDSSIRSTRSISIDNSRTSSSKSCSRVGTCLSYSSRRRTGTRAIMTI